MWRIDAVWYFSSDMWQCRTMIGNRGFTLIEALVALVIIAIGVLGIGSLVLQSLRASTDANQNTMAAILALDVNERAWIEAAGGQLDDCDWDQVTGLEGAPHPFWAGEVDYLAGAGIRVTGAFPDCDLIVEWDGNAGGVFGDRDDMQFVHAFVLPDLDQL